MTVTLQAGINGTMTTGVCGKKRSADGNERSHDPCGKTGHPVPPQVFPVVDELPTVRSLPLPVR